jgi:hypothetical protein
MISRKSINLIVLGLLPSSIRARTEHYLQLIIDNCIQFSYTAKSVYIRGCTFPENIFHAVLKERDHA